MANTKNDPSVYWHNVHRETDGKGKPEEHGKDWDEVESSLDVEDVNPNHWGTKATGLRCWPRSSGQRSSALVSDSSLISMCVAQVNALKTLEEF